MFRNRLFLRFLIVCFLWLPLPLGLAYANDVVLQNIQVEGLHYVKKSTFWYYFNVKPGQKLSKKALNNRILALYRTGFFDDVAVYRKGPSQWLVSVQERPILKTLTVDGSVGHDLLDAVKPALRDHGVRTGRFFQPDKLSQALSALKVAYEAKGYQHVDIKQTLKRVAPHEVALSLDVVSADKTKVSNIHFYGNTHYADRKILGDWTLAPTRFWSFITGSNIYMESKWRHDLEATQAFYRNHGFVDMKIVKSTTLFSKDKKTVDLSVYLEEGAPYTLSSYKLVGLNKDQVSAIRAQLMYLRSGAVYRQDDVTAAVKSIKRYLSDWGFIETNVDVLTHVDSKNHTVQLTLSVNTGKPFYVRHIVFKGNEKTSDSVLLSAMAQHEESIFSAESLILSQRKLSVLPYIRSVSFEPRPVLGRDDQVDLYAHVDERSATTLGLAVGYAQQQGLILNANFNNKNFLGLGRTLSVNFNRTGWFDRYSFDYLNPSFRPDGTALGFGLFYKHTKPTQVDLGDYVRDSYGGNINSSVPLSVNSHLTYGFSYERSKIMHYDPNFALVNDFVTAHGDRFEGYELQAGWQYSTQNSYLFPTAGQNLQFTLLGGMPLTDKAVGYYKLYGNWTYDHTLMILAHSPLVFEAHVDLGYGAGYGGYGSELPFFDRFYAGGIGSLKGFEFNSLGPRDANDNVMGGNVLSTFSLSVLYPSGFSPDAWVGVFLDGGNVFHDKIVPGDFRYSVGVRFTWNTPLNIPLVMSYGLPIHDKAGDRTQHFQFLIGTEF